MPRIPDSFIEELRARVRVSEVVGKRMKLRRAGKDFVAVDDPSFTVSDSKAIFHDFGKTGRTGDVFEFVMWQRSCTFEQAVEEVASIAGLPMPNAMHHHHPAPQGSGTAPSRSASADSRPVAGGNRNITAAYDYRDAEGNLLYQVCRVEFADAKGRKRKTFMQRRPAPVPLDGWIWGLSGGEFIRGRNGDWYVATDERREKWHSAEVRTFPTGVPHSIYRLGELRDEREQGEDARTVFIVEGEKDSNTLADWGILGVTNSGGAKHWTPDHAEMFRGLDVVILLDNDPAGRERGHLIGASLRGIAKRTRVLDWREHWPNCPEKGDVTDWRDLEGGNPDRLYGIVDKLSAWTPQRPESNFLAIPFNEVDRPAREFEWLIKKILTRGETSVWFGSPGCGKSFLLTDAAFAIARGWDWFGYKVRRGLVIYQAGEGGLGFKKRMRAYRMQHGLQDSNLPFVLLPTPINLYASDDDTDKIIKEIKLWQAYYDIPLELVVVDTFSAAAAGADENLSKDVGPVLARCRRIAMETRAHVAIVHHTPKGGGSPRGWSGFTGNAENVIEVMRNEGETSTEYYGTHTTVREVRSFVVRKQKDGEDGFGKKFVLKGVVLGRDVDDDEITSCVVMPANASETVAEAVKEVPKGYADLPPNARALMRSLVETIKRHGRLPPEEKSIKAPPGTYCVTIAEWREVRRETLYAGPEDDDPGGKKLANRIKKQIERTYESGLWTDKQHLIGKDGEWIWRTDRRVFGIDPPPVDDMVNQAMLLTPEEEAGDISDVLAGMDSGRY